MATQLTQVTFPNGDYIKDTKAWSDITGKPSTFTPSAHTHYELATIGDQRSTATTPNTYANRLIFQGLKNQGTIGNPGGTSGYSYLLGLRGWADPSGGNSHEIAFNNNGVYLRNGATTAWGNWSKIFTSSDTYSGTLTSSQVTTALGYTPSHEPVKDIPATPASIATFTDGSDLPMPKLEVAIEPQQDLHGYDAPWVGGAGKNKLQNTTTTQTISGVTYTVNADGTISLSGTASSSYSQIIIGKVTLPTGTYKISDALPLNVNYELYIADVSGASTKYTKDKEFTITEEATNKTVFFYIAGGQNVNGLTLKPMIRLASVTDATYAPYSNECPISGWSEVDVTKCGKNLFDASKATANSAINASGQVISGSYYVSGLISVKPNTSVYVLNIEALAHTRSLVFYGVNKELISVENVSGSNVANSFVKEIPNNVYYIRIGINPDYINNSGVNYPSTDTNYHAYNGQTYTIQLGDTYYGGKLRIINGVVDFVADKVEAIYDGSSDENWIYTSTLNRVYVNIPNAKKGISGSILPIQSNLLHYSQGYKEDYGAHINDQGNLVVFAPNDITDANAWKTWLASNNVQVVYELATPIEIQLTPTQVNSLMGVNNIWADCGDVLNGKYVMQDYSDITSKVSDFAQLASKLGSSNVGSATQPIYLNAGSPAACTYTLGKSVPSDAVFTDTKVTQTPTTTNATYELLFSGSADNTERTEGVRKSQYATFNPSKKAFTFGSRASGSTVGEYSLAEGNGTIASGTYSHAEGYMTTASEGDSHAEGSGALASGGAAHAEGGVTVASGECSHAEGAATTAIGDNSHAEGRETVASNEYSHAEGCLTIASGEASHAEGYLTVASGSTASHAEGYKTTASGYMSHAEGAGTISSKEYSHAEGDTSQANGVASHSEGYFCIASTSNSHAEGEKTTASGKSSHTEGYHTKTASYYTHAEGDSSYAGYIGAHAEGGGSTATGHYSHAEGQQTLSSSTASHAEGYLTIASGEAAHSEGYGTTANGDASHAEGWGTIANHASQHVFGEYNIPDPSTKTSSKRGNYVEIVGNGDVSTSSNARTLDWDGNETLAGTLILNGGNVNLGTSSSASDDSGDIAFFYGNGQEKARIFSANEFTSYDDLNYRCYKKDGTLLGNSHLATRKDIVPISGGKAITTSTSMAYTGLSFVVPPLSVVSVTVRAVWQYGWPKIIGVSTSSSSQGSSLIASNVQYSGVGHLSTAVNYYNASSSNLTLYIWAQYSSASSNTINYWGYSQRYDA